MRKLIKVLDHEAVKPLSLSHFTSVFLGVQIVEEKDDQKIILRVKRNNPLIWFSCSLFLIGFILTYYAARGYILDMALEIDSNGSFDSTFCLIAAIIFGSLSIVSLLALLREIIYSLNNEYIFDQKNQEVTHPVGIFRKGTVNFQDCRPELWRRDLRFKSKDRSEYKIVFKEAYLLNFEINMLSEDLAIGLWSTIVCYMTKRNGWMKYVKPAQ